MKIWQKTIAVLASFALLINSLSAPLIVLAQESTPEPTPEATAQPTDNPTQTPNATIAPTDNPTSTPDTTPIDLVTPTPDVTPIATDLVTPTPTNTPVVTQAPESNPTVQGPPSVNETVTQSTNNPSSTPSATPEIPDKNGHISALILKDTKVDTSAIDQYDVTYQEDGSASISTDKLDYSPTDTAVITGVGFTSGKTYTINITSSDTPAVNFSDSVAANDKGEILYSYQLDGNFRPNYKAEIKDLERVVASVTFTDMNPITTVSVSNLQPSWSAVGGGGVWSSYQGPNDGYTYDSPGSTDTYLGREAAPIYAGVTIDPVDGVYEDQGLFAFKPGDVPVATFAIQTLTYDFANQYGTAPVWIYIELNKGLAGDIMYQYVPTANPTWHTEDAATGTHWQAWIDTHSGITTGPMLSLADIATANPGKTVSRIYLTEGMGDSYHSTPNGTVAWVDKVTIGNVTYDFVVAPTPVLNPTTNAATGITSTDATLNGTNGDSAATEHSFWVSTSTFSTASPSIPAGVYSTPVLGAVAANTPFSASLSSITTTGVPTNLPAVTPSTKYYFAAWSEVGGTWYPGDVLNFTTGPAPDTTPPAIPSLVSPANGVYRHTSNSNKSDWTDVTDPSAPVVYYYESSLSTSTNPDGSFSSTAYLSSALTSSEIMNPGEPEVTYYWHVKACDSVGNCSAWSPTWQIHIDNTAPTVPTNGTPNGTTIATNNFDFNWNASTDNSPITYKYQASQNPASSGGVLTTGLWTSGVLPTNMIHSSGAGDGTWYWQVKAVDAAGNESSWSPIWNVTIDTTPPTTPGQIGWTTENPPIGSDYTSGTDFNNYRTCGQSLNYSPMTNLWEPSTDANGVVGYDREVYSPEGTLIYSSSLPTNYVNGDGAVDGSTYWARVRAYDAAGNKSNWTAKCGITYDVSAPTVSVTSPLNGAYLKGTVTITADANDLVSGISKVEFYHNSVPPMQLIGTDTTFPYSITWDTTSAADGSHGIYAKAYDTANNTSSTTIPVIVDNTPPTIVSVDSDGKTFNIADLSSKTIKITFNENIANVPTIDVHTTVGNQSVNNCGDVDAKTFCFAYTIPVSQEMTHTIYISGAQDTAGNTMLLNNTHTFIVDTIAPTTTANAGTYSFGTWTNQNVNVTLACTDGGTSCRNTYWCYDDGSSTCQPGVSGLNYQTNMNSFLFDANGVWYLRFQSDDNAGNLESVVTQIIKIDKTAPSGGSISYTDGYYNTASSNVALTVNEGTDTGSGINTGSEIIPRSEALLSNGTCGAFGVFSKIYPSGSYPILTDSSITNGYCYSYEYSVTDNAFNTATYTSENVVKVDKTSPTGSWVTPLSGSTISGTVPLDFGAIDSLSGIASIVYSYSDGSPDFVVIGSNSWDTTTLPLGNYILRATVTDNAGNVVNFDETVGIAAVISAEHGVGTSYSSANITWTTDRPTSSRVVYDTVSHPVLGSDDNYGYAYSTTEDATKVTSHSVTLTGLSAGTTYFYRVISHGSPTAVGSEQSFATLSITGSPAPSSNEGGVLGISTSVPFKSWPKLAYSGTANTEENVLGAGTEATPSTTPEITTPTINTKPGLLKWILTHKKISLGVVLGLIIIVYLVSRKKKQS